MLGKERTYPSDILFKDANVMDIRQEFFLQCALYKCQYNIPTTALQNTRGSMNYNLRLPKTKTTCGQRCFTYLSPRAYNTLPNEIKPILLFSNNNNNNNIY